MSADRPAQRDGSSYTTIPSKYVLIICGHSRQSAVMLFDELVNETAVPRINANVRGSPGATRRIVVHDHPINVFAGHPRAFAPIGGEAVRRTRERNCCTADQRQCPPIARRGGSSYTTHSNHPHKSTKSQTFIRRVPRPITGVADATEHRRQRDRDHRRQDSQRG